jgi:SAM-dependent methyltransferase
MPDPVSDHYANLLARHYSWMFGLSFAEKVAEQHAILEPLLKEAPRGPAVDLGCGPGYQSMALIELDFNPIQAIDISDELLREFIPHIGRLPIDLHCADILSVNEIVIPETAAVIVCMGDTLTHLSSPDAVRRLFSAVAAALAPGGLFILTWRDLTPELTGADRFIPVRADDQRIMTCFLEYTSPTTVQVHDLVYTRNPATSAWTLEKSSYPKLRLSPAQIAAELAAAGLEPGPPGATGRLSLLVAARKASLPCGMSD